MSSLSSAFNSLPTTLSNKGLIWPGYILLVCLLSVVCFGTLKDHLLDMDDHEAFQDNVEIEKDFSYSFSSQKKQPAGRPLAELVKFFGYMIWGNTPGNFHLLVVAFHALAAILLARLALAFGLNLRLSLIGGLLFLVNVSHFRAIHWIAAIEYPIAATCGFSALLSYHNYMETGKSKWLCWFYGGVVLSTGALSGMAFLVPFSIYWSWLRGLDVKATLRRLIPLFALIAVELAFIVVLTPKENSTWKAINLFSENQDFSFFLGMGRLFLWLLSRMITTAHWLLVPLYQLQPWEFYVGAGGIAALGFLVYRGNHSVSLLSVWTMLSLLPFLPLNDTLILGRPAGPSRYLYLATAGSSLLLAWGIEKTTLRFRSWGRYLYTAILATIFTSSYFFLKQSEAVSFYSSGRNYIARGYIDTGVAQLKRAIRQGKDTINLQDAYSRLIFVTMGKKDQETIISEALDVFPEDPNLHIYKMVNDSIDPHSPSADLARKTLDTFKTPGSHIRIQIAPDLWVPLKNKEMIATARREIAGLYHNLGNGLFGREDFEKAALAYRRALEFDPDRSKTWQDLVGALAKAGFHSEAVLVAHQAVGRNPQAASVGLLINASVAQAASGRIKEAIAMSQRALGKNPTARQSDAIFLLYLKILEDHPGSASSEDCVRMGLDLREGGRTEDSISAFRLALEKDETNTRAQFGLALSCLALGQVEEADSLYAQGVARFGRAAAEEAGAPEGIEALISQGIQVEAARDLLATHFPEQ